MVVRVLGESVVILYIYGIFIMVVARNSAVVLGPSYGNYPES